MTMEILYSLLGKNSLQMGTALKKCKVILKDADYFTYGPFEGPVLRQW